MITRSAQTPGTHDPVERRTVEAAGGTQAANHTTLACYYCSLQFQVTSGSQAAFVAGSDDALCPACEVCAANRLRVVYLERPRQNPAARFHIPDTAFRLDLDEEDVEEAIESHADGEDDIDPRQTRAYLCTEAFAENLRQRARGTFAEIDLMLNLDADRGDLLAAVSYERENPTKNPAGPRFTTLAGLFTALGVRFEPHESFNS